MRVIKSGVGKGTIQLGETIPISEYMVIVDNNGSGAGNLAERTDTYFTIASNNGSQCAYQVIKLTDD